MLNLAGLLGDDAGFNLGDGLVVVTALSFALYIIFLEKRLVKIDGKVFVLFQVGFITIFSCTISILFEDWGAIFGIAIVDIFSPPIIAVFLYMGIIATSATFFIHSFGQKRVPAIHAAIILSFEPLFGVIFGILIGSEFLTLFTLIGFTAMISGIIISQIKFKDTHG